MILRMGATVQCCNDNRSRHLPTVAHESQSCSVGYKATVVSFPSVAHWLAYVCFWNRNMLNHPILKCCIVNPEMLAKLVRRESLK